MNAPEKQDGTALPIADGEQERMVSSKVGTGGALADQSPDCKAAVAAAASVPSS